MQKFIVLTFDDAVDNHLSYVVPILQDYGFGATFFICHSKQWIDEHPECYLSWKDIRKIRDAGFEIGNHTLNHFLLSSESETVGRRDVSELNKLLVAEGIPKPVSFAYPGGPYVENAAKWLKEYGLQCARTTSKGLWDGNSDPMNISSWSVNAKKEENLQLALFALTTAESEPCAAVLTYHGVPDIAHPGCNTPPEMFKQHMNILRDSGYSVLCMKDFHRLITRKRES